MLESADALEATPPSLAPEAAQRWCNFIVWKPAGALDGLDVTRGTVRKEAPPGVPASPTAGRTPWTPNNPAAYRFEIGDGHYRVRLKQFLYDWAFPALDHPCLWASPTRAVAVDDDHVLWFGTDYMGRPAASARLGRTTVELSVLDGSVTDDEIIRIYRSLAPADPEAAGMIVETPLAWLSYFATRPEAGPVKVPIGLWQFHRSSGHTTAWRAYGTPPLGLPAEVGGLELDSVGEYTYPDGRGETEVVYSGGHLRAREIRVIAQEPGRGGLTVPAAPDKHPGTFVDIDIDGVAVQLAWIDPRLGPFHAVARTDRLELMVLAGTSVGLTREAFVAAVREILR